MLYSCALQLTHMVTVGVRGLDLRFYYKNLTVNLEPFLTGIASELTGENYCCRNGRMISDWSDDTIAFNWPL